MVTRYETATTYQRDRTSDKVFKKKKKKNRNRQKRAQLKFSIISNRSRMRDNMQSAQNATTLLYTFE